MGRCSFPSMPRLPVILVMRSIFSLSLGYTKEAIWDKTEGPWKKEHEGFL